MEFLANLLKNFIGGYIFVNTSIGSIFKVNYVCKQIFNNRKYSLVN